MGRRHKFKPKVPHPPLVSLPKPVINSLEEQVLELRTGSHSIAHIARLYNIPQVQVREILMGALKSEIGEISTYLTEFTMTAMYKCEAIIRKFDDKLRGDDFEAQQAAIRAWEQVEKIRHRILSLGQKNEVSVNMAEIPMKYYQVVSPDDWNEKVNKETP